MNLEERLQAVINSLEKSQTHGYSPMTNLVLSYLHDIKDDKLPKWVKLK